MNSIQFSLQHWKKICTTFGFTTKNAFACLNDLKKKRDTVTVPVMQNGNEQLKRENEALKQKNAELENQLCHQKHGYVMTYPEVISHLTQGRCEVVEGNEVCRQNIVLLAENAILAYNSGDIFPGRSNEFGNHMETFIKSFEQMIMERPLTIEGKRQHTGYPDWFVNVQNGTSFYLEIKIFKKGSATTSLRSFFISRGNKITKTCPHYLLGFEHNKKILTGNWHIVDLFTKKLRLKCEWNTSNKGLYCL